MDDHDQIEEIKSKLDIVSVVQQYVPNLKRSGNNYFGLCPFHKEKTPSFSVNSELGLFKCFGCGEGGDVIKFLQSIEGLDFPKALELSAQKAGVTLNRTVSKEHLKIKEEKDTILQANKLAAKLFSYILLKHPAGEMGRKYIQKRKFKNEQIKDFGIGYAPKSFDNLKQFLNKKGYKDQDLVKWGLLVEKNGKIYDKFRGRLMFTIINHQGDIVGFSGRKIFEDDLGPKYLNSPETLVYKKSQTLFGLYQAKEFIRKENFVILVEGQPDLITSHSVGVKNVVAPLGTALTPDQLKLLKRYTDKIYFAYNSDEAGQKALIRSYQLAEAQNLESYVIEIKGFKDVDELINGGGNWQKIVSDPTDVINYFIDQLAAKYDFSNPRAKAKYISEIVGYISNIKNPVAVADYIRKVSEKADVDQGIINDEVNKRISEGKKDSSNQSSQEKQEDQHLRSSPLPTEGTIQRTMIENLIIEFIALISQNKEYSVDEKFIEKILGSGNGYQLYLYTVDKPNILNPDRFKNFLTEIQMRPDQAISDERTFNHLINILGKRIISERTKTEIHKIRLSTADFANGSLESVNEKVKLLKR